jgi:Ca2+-binding EF-hand superfamily protein
MRKCIPLTAVALAAGLGATTALAQSVLFTDLDADQDNQITRDEFVAYSEDAYTRAIVEHPEDKLFTRDYTEQRIHRDDEPVDTVNIDGDEDDYVSMEEAEADWEVSFNSLDENGDGAIDEDEWAAIGK